MVLKIFHWIPYVSYGYSVISILANSKEEAIDLIQKEQDKHTLAEKEVIDYERKIKWKGGVRCGHSVKECTCIHRVTPELRKLWDKYFRTPSYSSELLVIKTEEPTILNLNKPQIIEIGGYNE